MKKNSIRLMGGVLLAVFAFSVNLHAQQSFRYQSTAGLFSEELDRMSDNPAYVGAKLNDTLCPEYAKSITKEKSNLYTGLTGIDGTDNAFLLGTSTRIANMFGLGLLTKFAWNQTAENANANLGTNTATTNINVAGRGTAQKTETINTDSNADGVFDNTETISGKNKYYTYQQFINGKFVFGGFNVGPAILGISFERDCNGTIETKQDSSYNYSNTRLLDNYVTRNVNENTRYKSTTENENYNTDLGFFLPLSDIAIDGVLSLNILGQKTTSGSGYDYVDSTSGSTSTSVNVLQNDSSITSDGFELGLTVRGHINAINTNWQPYISFAMGGLTPNKDGKLKNTSVTNVTYYNEPTRVDLTSNSSITSYSASNTSTSNIGIGVTARKSVATSVLFGFGAQYNIALSEDQYKSSFVKNNVVTAVNPLLSTDTVTTTSGSYTDTVKTEKTIHNIHIPMGLEFTATDNLVFRLGYSHDFQINSTQTTTKRSGINEDYTVVTGSTNASGPATASNYARDRASQSTQVTYTQNNTYNLGLGYNVSDTFQIDLGVSTIWGSYNDLDAARVSASATYLF